MAQIQNRKGNFYSQKQFIRDELSAPVHLETAGDVLIKQLSKKQLKTCTSLQEQLETVQNFEKGFDLNPDNRKGVTCLEEYKKSEFTQSDIISNSLSSSSSSSASASSSASLSKQESNLNLEELMKDTGLTRHELELGLSEKPHSAISQLYMFAIGNRKRKCRDDSLGSNHPLNQLKQIEEEYFGEKKKAKDETEILENGRKKVAKKRKHRKRKRKSGKSVANSTEQSVDDSAEESETDVDINKSFEHNSEKNVAGNVEENVAHYKGKSFEKKTNEKFIRNAEKRITDNTVKRSVDNSEKNFEDNTGKTVEEYANKNFLCNTEKSIANSAEKSVINNTGKSFVYNAEKNVAENRTKSVAIISNENIAAYSENKIKHDREINDGESTGNCVADKSASHSDSQTKRPFSPDETKEHSRISLWDVKDMKKWSECKKIGCKPPALYTIKNGKIIKLTEKSETET